MKGLLIGFGSIGRRHMTNLHDLGVTDWAVVRSGRGTLPFEPPCPVRIYSDLAHALTEEQPSFAVVANPTNLHVATAVACLTAGVPVLLEKPVAHTLADADALLEVATGSPPVLVGFQFRHHPALHRIAGLLADGTIGTPLHARSVWGEHLPSWHPWEDYRIGYAARFDLGGGVHHTICHPIDYLHLLFGEPLVVQASLHHHGPLGLEVAEAADVQLRFPGDVGVQLHLDYWSRPPVHRLEVVGTEGSIVWDFHAASLAIWTPGAGWATERTPGVDERNDLFVAQSSHFLDVVGGDAAPACTVADGVAAVRTCVAIERSALPRDKERKS